MRRLRRAEIAQVQDQVSEFTDQRDRFREDRDTEIHVSQVNGGLQGLEHREGEKVRRASRNDVDRAETAGSGQTDGDRRNPGAAQDVAVSESEMRRFSGSVNDSESELAEMLRPLIKGVRSDDGS